MADCSFTAAQRLTTMHRYGILPEPCPTDSADCYDKNMEHFPKAEKDGLRKLFVSKTGLIITSSLVELVNFLARRCSEFKVCVWICTGGQLHCSPLITPDSVFFL